MRAGLGVLGWGVLGWAGNSFNTGKQGMQGILWGIKWLSTSQQEEGIGYGDISLGWSLRYFITAFGI